VSRAFIKETDDTFESLPDRPISSHQNLVTPEGLELIEAALARLRQKPALAQSAHDRAAQARITRDLRYWTSRHSTAQVVHAPKDAAVVRFGCKVTTARDDGRQESYRIVGVARERKGVGARPSVGLRLGVPRLDGFGDARDVSGSPSTKTWSLPFGDGRSRQRDHPAPPLRELADIEIVFAHEIELAVGVRLEHGHAGRNDDDFAVPANRGRRQGSRH
jgi:hypothetical protein